jgi:hypothetical protein
MAPLFSVCDEILAAWTLSRSSPCAIPLHYARDLVMLFFVTLVSLVAWRAPREDHPMYKRVTDARQTTMLFQTLGIICILTGVTTGRISAVWGIARLVMHANFIGTLWRNSMMGMRWVTLPYIAYLMYATYQKTMTCSL